MEEQQAKRIKSKKKLAALVVGLVIIVVLGFAFYYTEGTKKELGNAVVLAICADVSDAQRDTLAARLTEYAPPDERGPVTVERYLFPEGYSDPQGAKLLALIETMNAGDPNLYLLDQRVYELIRGRVELRELSVDYPGDPALYDGEMYLLSDRSFWPAALENLPDCYAAVQREDTYAVTKDARTQQYYSYQLALLDNIVQEQPGRKLDVFDPR